MMPGTIGARSPRPSYMTVSSAAFPLVLPFFFLRPHRTACGQLHHQGPSPPLHREQSLNHWAARDSLGLRLTFCALPARSLLSANDSSATANPSSPPLLLCVSIAGACLCAHVRGVQNSESAGKGVSSYTKFKSTQAHIRGSSSRQAKVCW